ncbi:MAG: diphthamide biosynthesis enzyme Dph2 [Methanocella sp.]|jgi:2-(3-amino-3-carboxypropyl)histidine synthase
MPSFDFEEQRIIEEIRRLNAKRVLLQMPQGLKPQATGLAQIVEEAGAVAIISSDPCYGACDIALFDAEAVGADLVVHFGHARMVPDHKPPALYIETHAKIPLEPALQQALPLLIPYKTVGLTTSIQHINAIAEAKQFLTSQGKTVHVGDAGQLAHAGQVIGCNYSNPKAVADQVDAFLFIGGGVFHALGIALGTGKPTIIADPYDNRAYSITDEAQRLLKQRYASITAAKDAQTIGVLVGLKPGQKHLDHAFKAKALAEKTGRAAYLLAGREITPDALMEFPQIDAYVNTACPRISLDAPSKFQKPILTVNEFMVLCGEVSWNDMIKKGLFEN